MASKASATMVAALERSAGELFWFNGEVVSSGTSQYVTLEGAEKGLFVRECGAEKRRRERGERTDRSYMWLRILIQIRDDAERIVGATALNSGSNGR